MNKSLDFWVVCDPIDNSRRELARLLREIGVKTVNQYPSLEHLMTASGQSNPNEPASQNFGVTGLITTLAEGVPSTCRAIRYLRKSRPDCLILVIANSVTNAELSQLVQSGISQIIVSTLNRESLQDKINQALKFQSILQIERRNMPADLSFNSWISETGENIHVLLSGWVTEQAALPEIKNLSRKPFAVIDCEGVAGLNSLGIRLWMIWVKSLEDVGFKQIEFENIHRRILSSLSMVKGSLSKIGVLNSLYITYENVDLDEEIELKIVRNKDFNESQIRVPGKVVLRGLEGKDLDFNYDMSNHIFLKKISENIEIINDIRRLDEA